MVPVFDADVAQRLRKRLPRPGDTRHVDELFIRVRGELHYLWRAMDEEVVLETLEQERRNTTAARRIFMRLLAGLKYRPRKIVIDALRSHGVTHREVLPDARCRTSRHLNNRAENSHRSTRSRERQM